MVAGARPAATMARRRRPSTGTTRDREGGGRRRCPGGRRAHPEHIGVAGRGRCGRTARIPCAHGGGRRRGRSGRCGGFGRSRSDSGHGEVEEEPAELVPVSPGLGAAGVSGVHDGGGGRMRELDRGKTRVAGEGAGEVGDE